MSILNTKLEFLKGVGEKKAEILKKELGILTYKDLLSYYPYKYVDKSQYIKIREIQSEDIFIQIKGKVISKEIVGVGAKSRLVVRFADESGMTELLWFKGIKWISQQITPQQDYVIFGKPTFFNGAYNFTHPEIETLEYHQQTSSEKYSPLYSTTEKMKNSFLNSKAISRIIKNLIIGLINQISETLPSYILSHYHLVNKEYAIFNIHFPISPEALEQSKKRLKFEELFFMQLEHQMMRNNRINKSDGFIFSVVGENFNNFYNNYLPFQLTKAQQRVVKEIRSDMRTGHQMNRLLQGDVGSGKTLVGLLCMLIALDNGFQCAMMAPTEILARQHYLSIKKFLSDMDVNVTLLTGSTKQKDRKKILPELENGRINIIIGTHSLLEDKVVFNNLGLVVIDEQHRFGVQQRAKMWTKNHTPPHILVMTATPIPRTLAMTVYGDLDCSIIDELPPGRKPIQTAHFYDKDRLRLFAFMRKQIEKGHQIYVVYPLINESEKLDLKDLMDGYESIVREFPLPEYQISIVHGQLKPEDKDYEMERFKKGITHIMVSTTVIEVGVDVPNASVMVIENAERFGLSQLHQLRGRVGRGADQSYCILMSSYKLSNEGKTRLETMCKTNDGFEIAEADLRLRGPGDMAGTKQSGVLDLKIADIIKDEPILRIARELAISISVNDPNLSNPDNFLLREFFRLNKPKTDFSQIS